MDNGNLSLADIAAVTGSKDTGAFGGSSGLWIFGLLILLLLGGGGGLFGGGAATALTQADLCMNSQFQNLNQNVNDIGQRQFAQSSQHGRDLAQVATAMIQNFDNTNSNIDSVKFDMANYVASINATTTANTQRVLDKMCENEKAAMQAKIQSLELAQAMNGVPRINPYGYGIVPTFCCCGQTNI